MPHDLRFTLDNCVFELRAAAIVIRRPTCDPADARLLMVTNTVDPYAYSVGGAVEFGETTGQAAAREVLEETGTALPLGPLAAIEQIMFTDGSGRLWHVVTHHYWVDAPADFHPNRHSVGLDGVDETLRWFSLDDLSDIVFYPRCYRDALTAQWDGIRYFVECDRTVNELA